MNANQIGPISIVVVRPERSQGYHTTTATMEMGLILFSEASRERFP
jgi:hypothetical protein